VIPPRCLIRGAVAGVWLYEGLWCKLLGREPGQLEIVQNVPLVGPRVGRFLLKTLGAAEVGLGLWALSGICPLTCALAQTMLLVFLNTNGILWSRGLIHDPAGMVVKNFAFLVLAWVSALH
jgi:hypothetical protein